jgi:DNA polymerase III sliding clamp (beta) subunit (PCNA family)
MRLGKVIVMELVTLNSDVLHALLKGGMVASGTDKYLPALNTVQIEVREPLVRVVATDRYRLVIGDVDIDTTSKPMEIGMFKLYLDNVKDLVKALPIKKDNGDVTISLSDDGKYATFTYSGSAGGFSREYRTADGEFPKYESLIPKEFNGTTEIRFNPSFMADIAKLPMKDKNTGVSIRFNGSNKPMLAAVEGSHGIQWEYLLMPVYLK